MAQEHKLTKKERKELRKMEWADKAKVNERNAQVKKYSIWAGAIIIVVAVIAGLVWLVNYSPSSSSAGTSVTVAPISAKDMVRGNKDAKIKLIEYGDFQCPACGAYYPLVKQLIADEGDNLYFVYRFFPLVSVHPNAFVADQAAYAAFKQDKFWDMYDLLYTNQNDWAPMSDPQGTFNDYAKKLGLDVKKFQTDYNSAETKKYVQDSEDRSTSEGINSTPTFIINGIKITNPQSYAEFKKLVDDELNKK